MGNNLSSSSPAVSSLREKYTVTSKDLEKGVWVLKNVKEQQYILKELTTNDQMQSERVKQLTAQKRKDDNPYILKLEDSLFEREKNYCTIQYKSYLVFEKPFKDLRSEMNERLIQHNSFDNDQLMSIIETGTLGLKYLKSINHPHHYINSSTLFLSGTGIILLSDPWINDSGAHFRPHSYPCPQTLELGYRSKKQQLDWVASGLFSLGIVVLEMYYLQYMDDLYEGSGMNALLLKNRVQGIKYPEVRKFVEQLVSTKRKRLLLIPEMEKYVDGMKEGNRNVREVRAQSNVIYNRIPESNISRPGGLMKKLSKSPQKQQQKVQQQQFEKHQIQQHQQSNYRRIMQSPNKLQGLVAVSPQRFNRIQYHQPQIQPQKYYNPSLYQHSNRHQSPTQSQYMCPYSNKSFEQNNSTLNSQHYSNGQIYNSIEINKDQMPHSSYEQINPRYKEYQHNYQPSPSSLVFSNSVNNQSNNFTHNSPSIMSLSNFNYNNSSINTNSYLKQSYNHMPTTASSNMSTSFNVVTSFNGQVGQSSNLNKSVSSLLSYPKTMNQSIYQQDHYIQPKQTPNLLLNYLPDQIIHTSAVSQIHSDGSMRHHQQDLLQVNQTMVSKEVSDLLECSYRSPIGVIQHSSIDEDKIENQQFQVYHSRNKSDEQYLLRYQDGDEDKIQEAIEKQKRQIEKYQIRVEPPVQRINPFDRQNQAQTSPPVTVRGRKMNSTIIQVSDSENKSEGYGEIEFYAASSMGSDKFQMDSQRFVIQHYGDGMRYEGQKLHGKKHGEGKYVYEDGAYVQGLWKNDQLCGPGRLYYANGKLAYDGQYYMGYFHGFGKVFNAEPEPIGKEGVNYQNFSTMTEEWESYEGQIKKQEKHGSGKLKYSNGDVYQGEFREDKADGKGIFYVKNGESIKGVWKNNKLIEII